MILLSVIVPVYNVERFLPRCLDSLLRQDMKEGKVDLNYEIICVDDGSTDACPSILADYARREPSLIKVITQTNQGLGPARNTGMAAARGEYIAFVDSDDYVIDGGFGYLCNHFLDGNPDVLHYQVREIFSDGLTVICPDTSPEGSVIYDGDGVKEYNHLPLHSVWQNFYKRDFLKRHDLKFENIVCEDTGFNFDVFQKRPTMRIVNSDLYRYEQGNSGSILSTAKKERVMAQLDSLLYETIGKVEKYLGGGETELAEGARKVLKKLLTISYEKYVCVFMTRNEWRKYTRRFNALSVYVSGEVLDNNGFGGLFAKMIELSSKSYLLYCVIHFLKQRIWQSLKVYVYAWKPIVKK